MRTKKKNIMRSPEEKKSIVLEAIEYGIRKAASKYDVSRSLLQKWIIKYNKGDLKALKSNTGKKSGNGKGRPTKPKTREEELERENLKLKVEVARLKKGYQVKGVGSKKEYVTIKDLNTKS